MVFDIGGVLQITELMYSHEVGLRKPDPGIFAPHRDHLSV